MVSVHTDEWPRDDGLTAIGRGRATVSRAEHEWARDDDGDGVREVHRDMLDGAVELPAAVPGREQGSPAPVRGNVRAGLQRQAGDNGVPLGTLRCEVRHPFPDMSRTADMEPGRVHPASRAAGYDGHRDARGSIEHVGCIVAGAGREMENDDGTGLPLQIQPDLGPAPRTRPVWVTRRVRCPRPPLPVGVASCLGWDDRGRVVFRLQVGKADLPGPWLCVGRGFAGAEG